MPYRESKKEIFLEPTLESLFEICLDNKIDCVIKINDSKEDFHSQFIKLNFPIEGNITLMLKNGESWSNLIWRAYQIISYICAM